MSEEIEITVLPSDTDIHDNDFVTPSNFYCVNALSERVFFKTRSRAKAQEACDKLYGKGHYVIHAVKNQKTNKPISVRGVETR